MILLLTALPIVCPTSNSPAIRTKLTGWTIRLNRVMGFFFFSLVEFIWVHHGAFKHVVANIAMCSKHLDHDFKMVKEPARCSRTMCQAVTGSLEPLLGG